MEITLEAEILARGLLKHRSRLTTHYQRLAVFITHKIFDGKADPDDIAIAEILYKKTGQSE